MDKKAQGISINVIIIAILALVVLVLIIAIFTGKMGQWVAGLKGTEAAAYKCYCNNPIDEIDQVCSGQDLTTAEDADYREKFPSQLPAECNQRYSDCFTRCWIKEPIG